MVRRFRSGVGAVLLVLTLMAMVSGTVLASGHIASDGQTLADQSQEVQDLYASVYGDDAAVRWAIEHDRELGFDRAAADDMAMGDITLTQEYQDVYAAALERSGDAELSHRIALDVLGRGTTAAFLAGTDPGVLYGIWVEPVAAERVVTRTRTVTVTVPGSSAPSAPAAQAGTGLFAGISQAQPRVPAMDGDRSHDAAVSESAGLRRQRRHVRLRSTTSPVCQMASSQNDMREISGTTRGPESSTITYTVTEMKTEAAVGNAEAVVTESTGVLTFTITVVEPTPAPDVTFGSADIADRTLFVDDSLLINLPSASGGADEDALTYTLNPETGAGLNYDAGNRELYSGSLTVETVEFTWTATDPSDATNSDEITFTITVEANTEPALDAPDCRPVDGRRSDGR